MNLFGSGVDIGGGQKVLITKDWVKVLGVGGIFTKQQYPLGDVHGVVSPERNVLNFVGAGGSVLGSARITKPLPFGIHNEIQKQLETMQRNQNPTGAPRNPFKWP
jgi:hypothetical protein